MAGKVTSSHGKPYQCGRDDQKQHVGHRSTDVLLMYAECHGTMLPNTCSRCVNVPTCPTGGPSSMAALLEQASGFSISVVIRF